MVAMGQCGLGHGSGDNGPCDKAAEHEAPALRCPSVEAERKSLQVRLEVLCGHGSPVDAEDPSIEQTGDSMDTWLRNIGRILGRRKQGSLMCVSAPPYSVVARPAVGADPGIGLDNVADERPLALPRRCGNVSHPDQTEALGLQNLHCDDHDRLRRPLRPRFPARSMHPTRVSSASASPECRLRSALTLVTR